jgi:TonB family protein
VFPPAPSAPPAAPSGPRRRGSRSLRRGLIALALGCLWALTQPAWARRPKDAPAPEGAPTAEEAAPVEEIIEPPKVVVWVDATWPAEALAAGLEARVGLQVTLDAEGAVTAVTVAHPAGQGFDEAAAEAVGKMVFAPARTASGPVAATFLMDYVFRVETEAPPPVGEPNVEGRLIDVRTDKPIADATVYIELPDGTRFEATSDADGAFALRGLPEGRYTATIDDVYHELLAVDLEVVAGNVTRLDLSLVPLVQDNRTFIIVAEKPKTEVTQRSLSTAEIKRIPGTFGDPVKAIQTLPGAARSPFGTGLLIIRGANPEDTAVYVDGIRVPIIYHLTGTTSVLNPDAVAGVDYLPGGYGVQFGRSTAGTVNVRTKDEFKDKRLVWSTDVLDTQVWFEGNLGKNKQHGLALGARRSYIDLFIPIFTANQGFDIKPVYWDYQAKWIPKLGANDKFSLFVYGFQDVIQVGRPADQAAGTDQDTQGNFSTTYQSHRFVAKWEHDFNPTLKLTFQPSAGVDLVSLGLGSDFGLANRNWIIQYRAELSWRPSDHVEFIPGMDFIGGPWRFDFRSAVSFADLDDPLAERDPVGFDGKGTAWSPDTYVKFNWRPLKDPQKWLVATGVRFSHVTYYVGGGVTFGEDVEPAQIGGFDARLSTRYIAFEKGEMRGTIKASTGWYSQPPQPFESIGLGVTTNLSPERAWNSSLGFEHRITPVVSWDLDVFYRRMDRLVDFNDGFSGRGSQPFANTGRGYAAGFELILRHNPHNHFFGWLSYTFSRSFRLDGSADGDKVWYPFDFDQPHIFSAQGGYDFPKGFGVSLQLQVVSGNPTSRYNASVYDADGDFYNSFQIGMGNGERLPTFAQTSFRVDKTWVTRAAEVELYLDLINAIRGVNPETTVYNYDSTEWAYVRGLPFIPNLGFEVRFWP